MKSKLCFSSLRLAPFPLSLQSSSASQEVPVKVKLQPAPESFLTHHESVSRPGGSCDSQKQTHRYKNAKPAYDRCMGEQMTDFTPIRLHNS